MNEPFQPPLDELVPPDELRRNAESYRLREAEARPGQRVELIVFRLDAQWLALSLPAIREIAPAQRLTRLPECPAAVLGLSNLRGGIVVVLDLRPLLGYGPESGSTARRFLLLEDRAGPTALAVDAVIGQVTCEAELFRPLTAGEAPGHALIRGVAQFEGRPLSWLDADRLLDLFNSALR
jgi:chemotaxis signal transduction protein